MEETNGAKTKAGDWQGYERVLFPPIRDLHQLEVYEQHGGYVRSALQGRAPLCDLTRSGYRHPFRFANPSSRDR